MGCALSEMNNLEEGESVSSKLPSVQDYKNLLKEMERLEKTEDDDDKTCRKLKETYNKECKIIKDKANCNSSFCNDIPVPIN